MSVRWSPFKPPQMSKFLRELHSDPFAHEVRAMKPFQCRHKCQNKRNFCPLCDKQAIASALTTWAILWKLWKHAWNLHVQNCFLLIRWMFCCRFLPFSLSSPCLKYYSLPWFSSSMKSSKDRTKNGASKRAGRFSFDFLRGQSRESRSSSSVFFCSQ